MYTKPVLKTWTSRLLVALLAFSLLAALLPQAEAAASPSAAAKCATSYTIKQGDTLATIAKKFDIKPQSIVVENKMAIPYPIFVGQRLCIPGKDASGSLASKYANAPAAYFTAGFTPNGIYVQPSNYPKNPVWVKGDNAADKVKNFVKIGKLNAKATGNSRVTFTMPAELKNAKTLTVCLKDILSDYNQCVTLPPRR
jgi:LysM repeat protein